MRKMCNWPAFLNSSLNHACRLNKPLRRTLHIPGFPIKWLQKSGRTLHNRTVAFAQDPPFSAVGKTAQHFVSGQPGNKEGGFDHTLP